MKKLLLITISICLFVAICLSPINISEVFAETTLDSYYCLRDFQYITTPNQLSYNTCWIFSLTKCLETTLAKKNNEYYDISEAYIMLAQKYNWKGASPITLGSSGGDMIAYFDLIEQYGLVNDADFTLDELAYIGEENYKERFNYYSQFSSKDLVEQLEYVNLGSYTTNTEAIKRHIKENGAVNINVQLSSGGHALTIIGWDDSVDEGSFIVLNSYGNEWGDCGVNTISYKYLKVVKVSGFKCKSDAAVTAQNIPEYETKIANKYNKNVIQNSQMTIHKNLFYYKNRQELIYNIADKVDKVYLQTGNKEQQLEFSQELNVLKIVLEDKNLQGAYKLKIVSGEKTYTKLAYFVGDVEFERIAFSSDSSVAVKSYYANFNATEDVMLVNSKVLDPSAEFKIELVLSAYSNCEISSLDNVTIQENATNNRIYTIIPKDKNEGIYEYNIKLKNAEFEKEYKIIYCISDSTYIANVKMQSNYENTSKYIFVDTQDILINTISNNAKLIKNKSEKELQINENQIILNASDVKFDTVKNQLTSSYCDKNYLYSAIIKTELIKPIINVSFCDKNQNISTEFIESDEILLNIGNSDIQVKSTKFLIDNNEVDLKNLKEGKYQITILLNYTYRGVEFEETTQKTITISAPKLPSLPESDETVNDNAQNENENNNSNAESVIENNTNSNTKEENTKILLIILLTAAFPVVVVGLLIGMRKKK